MAPEGPASEPVPRDHVETCLVSNHFSRSLRTLDGDPLRKYALALTVIVTALALWITWFVVAQVAVYAATGAARLAVEHDTHPIDAPVGGRVLVAPVPMGQQVHAGEVLLVLDADLERFARNEASVRLTPAASQLDSLRQQLQAERRALEEERRGTEAARVQSHAQGEQAAAAAQLAMEEAARLAALQRRGLVSEFDALRAKKSAEAQQALARSADAAEQLSTRNRHTQEEDRIARIASLTAAIAALQGTRDEVAATSARLGYEIERRQIRAPISGTLADVSPLRAGSVVHAGDRICSIVPSGGLKVVAFFTPAEALGRVRVGQVARVRFEGFPWTQYGSAPAHVTTVASEVRDGTIRAELSLDMGQPSLIPLQHGLPAEVDVEVERLSPAAMILRTIGRRLAVGVARTRT